MVYFATAVAILFFLSLGVRSREWYKQNPINRIRLLKTTGEVTDIDAAAMQASDIAGNLLFLTIVVAWISSGMIFSPFWILAAVPISWLVGYAVRQILLERAT